MNIAKQYVPTVLKAAEEKMKELSVQVNPANLDDYKLALSNISKNHSLHCQNIQLFCSFAYD